MDGLADFFRRLQASIIIGMLDIDACRLVIDIQMCIRDSLGTGLM